MRHSHRSTSPGRRRPPSTPTGASPPLLILDLGRPERFLHMLRVFKPRSMMNAGSSALSLFGLFGGLATCVELLEWFGRRRPAWCLLAGRWAPRYLVGAVGAGLLAPLALGDRPGGPGALRSLLVLPGALTTRFAWTEAGKESASDPRAYFACTAASGGAARRRAGEPGRHSAADAPTRQQHGMLPRAGLPTRGRITGTITLVQEDRFRLEDAQGRGYLFTLGRGLGIGLQHLRQWSARRAQLEVDYEGAPDLGGVAVGVREHHD